MGQTSFRLEIDGRNFASGVFECRTVQMLESWKRRARSVRRDIRALYLARRDPRIPWYARLLAVAIVAYALSPIDLIPDFIPFLGYLDDLMLVPIGVVLLVKLIPPGVLDEYRIKAGESDFVIAKSRAAAIFIVALWVCGTVLAFYFLCRHRLWR